jgi:hypothetical protein
MLLSQLRSLHSLDVISSLFVLTAWPNATGLRYHVILNPHLSLLTLLVQVCLERLRKVGITTPFACSSLISSVSWNVTNTSSSKETTYLVSFFPDRMHLRYRPGMEAGTLNTMMPE